MGNIAYKRKKTYPNENAIELYFDQEISSGGWLAPSHAGYHPDMTTPPKAKISLTEKYDSHIYSLVPLEVGWVPALVVCGAAD